TLPSSARPLPAALPICRSVGLTARDPEGIRYDVDLDPERTHRSPRHLHIGRRPNRGNEPDLGRAIREWARDQKTRNELGADSSRSEEHTSELQSPDHTV